MTTSKTIMEKKNVVEDISDMSFINRYMDKQDFLILRVKDIDPLLRNHNFLYTILPIPEDTRKRKLKAFNESDKSLHTLMYFTVEGRQLCIPIIFKVGYTYMISKSIFSLIASSYKCTSLTKGTNDVFKKWCAEPKNRDLGIIFDNLSFSDVKNKRVKKLNLDEIEDLSMDDINVPQPFLKHSIDLYQKKEGDFNYVKLSQFHASSEE